MAIDSTQAVDSTQVTKQGARCIEGHRICIGRCTCYSNHTVLCIGMSLNSIPGPLLPRWSKVDRPAQLDRNHHWQISAQRSLLHLHSTTTHTHTHTHTHTPNISQRGEVKILCCCSYSTNFLALVADIVGVFPHGIFQGFLVELRGR